ncbi:hypothetical protein SAMN05444406_10248 [Caldicoprobacter faecalis]|uniref:Uncharacterized protein n=1 Tax=Caldicoprobacter faecalis TaxID=937334 RepID=A0A1I5S9N1_9FIRM|nr:hypothetical protein SAMN05444406_10248 [Caldicoprobacter faecalis]
MKRGFEAPNFLFTGSDFCVLHRSVLESGDEACVLIFFILAMKLL